MCFPQQLAQAASKQMGIRPDVSAITSPIAGTAPAKPAPMPSMSPGQQPMGGPPSQDQSSPATGPVTAAFKSAAKPISAPTADRYGSAIFGQ